MSGRARKARGGAAVLRPLSSNVQPPPKQLQRWFSSTSSSSESDAEPVEASPPDTAARAALFRKLGIAGGGWESDSSAYYSSPDRPGGARAEGGSNGVAATPTADSDRAQQTIAALREELAAARQQADAASAELRSSDQQCRLLQARVRQLETGGGEGATAAAQTQALGTGGEHMAAGLAQQVEALAAELQQRDAYIAALQSPGGELGVLRQQLAEQQEEVELLSQRLQEMDHEQGSAPELPACLGRQPVGTELGCNPAWVQAQEGAACARLRKQWALALPEHRARLAAAQQALTEAEQRAVAASQQLSSIRARLGVAGPGC